MTRPAIVISCEHAGNTLPAAYKGLFTEIELASHRGYDIGALHLAKAFKLPIIKNMTTRLLVDVNRSLESATLFSHKLPPQECEKIVQKYYIPHRNRVLKAVGEAFESSEEVLHLSIHSFTPELNGVVRDVDIGLLFDPEKHHEAHFCRKLSTFLRKNSSFKICDNEPYPGKADGLTTTLRSLFPNSYRGIEIEVNQKFAKGNTVSPEIERLLVEGVAYAVR